MDDKLHEIYLLRCENIIILQQRFSENLLLSFYHNILNITKRNYDFVT